MKLDEIARDWTPPEGLGYSSLRPVRLSGGGYALTVLAVVLTIGGFVLGDVLWNQAQRENQERVQLEQAGVLAEATITRVWRDGSKEHTPRVSYRFEADGEGFTGRSDAPSGLWRTLKAGDSLRVRYLPTDPSVNHPADWRMSVTPQWLPLLIPVIFLGLAAMFGGLIRRQWRLLMEGRPAPGLVVKARRKDKQVVLTYEFRVLSGAIQKGRGSSNSRSVLGEGSVVCVLYDPENPRRSGIYPFQLVRLEGAPARAGSPGR